MKVFKIDFEFIDEENDLIKKTLELNFISQRFINRATKIFTDITQLQYLKSLLDSESDCKKRIDKEYKGAEKVKALNNMRINLKEYRKSMKELATKDLYKEKIDLIMDILRKNKIEDPRYYEYDFWESNVDPQEIQDLLENLITRGKKKELAKSLKKNLLMESKSDKENTI